MKNDLLYSSKEDKNCIPTLIIAMADIFIAEMIAELPLKAEFNPLALMDDGLNLMKRIKFFKPDFLLLDSELPNLSLLEFTENLKSLKLNVKVLIYASQPQNGHIHYFLDNKSTIVRGFIHKGAGVQILEDCLNEVFTDKRYFSITLGEYLSVIEKGKVVNLQNHYYQLELLPEQEKTVWNWMTQGKTESQIADLMCIAVSTVKSYKKRIKARLGMSKEDKLSYIALIYRLR